MSQREEKTRPHLGQIHHSLMCAGLRPRTLGDRRSPFLLNFNRNLRETFGPVTVRGRRPAHNTRARAQHEGPGTTRGPAHNTVFILHPFFPSARVACSRAPNRSSPLDASTCTVWPSWLDFFDYGKTACGDGFSLNRVA